MKLLKSSRRFDMLGYEVTIFVGDIDLLNITRRVQMNYYDLGKAKRWLEDGDSPYVIGGRDTDIGQIAYSLKYTVRELFPINAVPEELATQLNELEVICVKAEEAIAEMIRAISDCYSRINS